MNPEKNQEAQNEKQKLSKRAFLKGALAFLLTNKAEAKQKPDKKEKIKDPFEGIKESFAHLLKGHFVSVDALLRDSLPELDWEKLLGAKRGLVFSKRFHRYWLIKDGKVLKSFVGASGREGFETPTGNYRVVFKKGPDYSSKEYPTQQGEPPNMPWAVFLDVKNEKGKLRGIAVHGSPNRFINFAGKLHMQIDMSHGCINVTTKDAELINKVLKPGDPIVIIP